MTNSFPLYTIWTIIPDVDPVAYTLAHPGEAIQKSFSFARFLVVDFLSVYKPIFLLFSGIGLMLSQEDARIRFLKIMIIAGFIIQTIMLLPVGPVAYYYIFFFPLIIAIGASSATRILKNKSPWVLFCILAVFLVATVPYWKSTRQFNPFPEIGKQVAALTEKNDIIFTDIPWEITWYADRRTVWLTYDIDTLKTISKTLKPKHIVLFGYTYAPYKDNIWTRLAASPDVAREVGYRASHLIKIGDRPIAFMFTALE